MFITNRHLLESKIAGGDLEVVKVNRQRRHSSYALIMSYPYNGHSGPDLIYFEDVELEIVEVNRQ